MGRRGPRPIPSELRKLRGSRRPSKAGEPQPHVGTRTPSVPAWLPEEAKAVWHKYARSLWELRLLTDIDVMAFAVLCETMALYRTAVEMVGKGYDVQETESGYRQQDPWVSIRNNAISQMRKLWQEFGMTPSSRVRLDIEAAEAEELTLAEELFQMTQAMKDEAIEDDDD